VTTKIEQFVNSRMHGQESLSLLQRFESTHDPFSNSRWLMAKLRGPPIPGSARALSILEHMGNKD
jgi:hypothetical protein